MRRLGEVDRCGLGVAHGIDDEPREPRAFDLRGAKRGRIHWHRISGTRRRGLVHQARRVNTPGRTHKAGAIHDTDAERSTAAENDRGYRRTLVHGVDGRETGGNGHRGYDVPPDWRYERAG